MPADAQKVRRFPVPPHSVEAEQAVIGGLLLDQKSWPRVATRVSTADFYRSDHRTIFSTIAQLQCDGKVSDPVTVIEHLERNGQLDDAGGRQYIAQLVETTPSAANIEAYAKLVRDRFTMRHLCEVADNIKRSVHEAGDRGVAELIADAEEELLRLQERSRHGRGLVESRKLASELIDDLDRRAAGERGLSIGLGDFDRLTYGLEPGFLVVFAGRPGMGKTALMVSVAAHVARTSGVAIFSAEMSALQLTRRAVALIGGVPEQRLRLAHELTEDEWAIVGEAASKYAERNLHIDEKAAPTVGHIRAEVLALKARTSLGLVMVDYVQLLQGRGKNRYEELRDVSYGLKNLAKEAGVPVILLAQLNRAVEDRVNKRPRQSDLRDSGGIEEAADIVGMLYSEGYYDPDFGMPYVLECALEKNRNGPKGECLWHFAGEFSRVGMLEEGARVQYRRERAKARRGAVTDDL